MGRTFCKALLPRALLPVLVLVLVPVLVLVQVLELESVPESAPV
jgi:hypothetical protein